MEGIVLSYLYVLDQGAKISFSQNRFEVHYRDGMIHSVPAETLEVIEIFGKIQLTTPCIQECLKRGVNVIFFSMNGAYFGRLISTNHVNVSRQRMQADIGKNDSFNIKLSKRILEAKIKNQMVVIQRYRGSQDVDESLMHMRNMRKKIIHNDLSVEKMMGSEGYAARIYFQQIGKLINPDFAFTKRSRRPPIDPFNSLISLGYSILLNEIYGKLEAKGLNPYFGFLHKDREKHPTLASDLMEEWRAALIDTTAMAMVNGKELIKEDFYSDVDQPGVFLSKDAFKKYVKKLESKFRQSNKYLDYLDYSVTFRRAIDLQIEQLIKAMETEDPSLYHPLHIR